VEGPGNSLDRIYHYSVTMDVNYLAERVKNVNVGFVNLFRRHDKLWVNGKVRSAILQIDCVLMGHGTFHIGVIETVSCDGRIHDTWPASKFMRQEKDYASFC